MRHYTTISRQRLPARSALSQFPARSAGTRLRFKSRIMRAVVSFQCFLRCAFPFVIDEGDRGL
jgi:hypothetical protein